MYRSVTRLMCLLLFAAALGCGSTSDPGPAAPRVAVDSAKYVLHAEPEAAKGVLDLRKESKDGDDVVVIGRVGGSKQPVIKDRAAFTIVDMSLKPCDGDADECFDFT